MARKKTKSSRNPQDQIFKLRISLSGTEPLVWRRVLVPGNFTLEALHSVFQLSMGWQMCHLYDFQIGKTRYADPDDYSEDNPRSPTTSVAAALRDQTTFSYVYDYGDDWIHEVVVEEVMARDERVTYPACVAGENACPPEDCHGPSGYADLKKVIANPKHREYLEMMQWLGGCFDPTSFDINRINRDMLWQIDWTREPNSQGLYLPRHSYDEDESDLD